MIKKDIIIAVLATFCLTATLFMILPTRSSPGDYDPWIDGNDDGTIDIFDAITLAGVYGTSGDPTKYVNVTNWPATPQTTVFFDQNTSRISDYFDAMGFGHIHLIWYTTGLSGAEMVTLDIHVRIQNPAGGVRGVPITSMNITVTNREGVLTFPVPAEQFSFGLIFSSGTTAIVTLAFYLTYA